MGVGCEKNGVSGLIKTNSCQFVLVERIDGGERREMGR